MCVQDVDVQCVLQFTLIHAASCALHRRTSRVIHRIELCLYAILWVGLRLPCMCIHLNGLTVAGATPVSRPRLFRAVYSRTRGLGMACFRPATLVGAACHTHRTYALQRSRFGPVKDGAAVLRRQYRQGAPRTPCPLEYISPRDASNTRILHLLSASLAIACRSTTRLGARRRGVRPVHNRRPGASVPASGPLTGRRNQGGRARLARSTAPKRYVQVRTDELI